MAVIVVLSAVAPLLLCISSLLQAGASTLASG